MAKHILITLALILTGTLSAASAPSADDFTGVVGVTWDSTKESLLEDSSHEEMESATEESERLVYWRADVMGEEATVMVSFEKGRSAPYGVAILWDGEDQELALYRLFRRSALLLLKKYGKVTTTDVQGMCPDPEQEFHMANAIRFGHCQISMTWSGKKTVVHISVDGTPDKKFRLLIAYGLKSVIDRKVTDMELNNPL